MERKPGLSANYVANKHVKAIFILRTLISRMSSSLKKSEINLRWILKKILGTQCHAVNKVTYVSKSEQLF